MARPTIEILSNTPKSNTRPTIEIAEETPIKTTSTETTKNKKTLVEKYLSVLSQTNPISMPINLAKAEYNIAKNIIKNPKKAAITGINTGVQVGKGIIKTTENVVDMGIQAATSRQNPITQLLTQDGLKNKLVGAAAANAKNLLKLWGYLPIGAATKFATDKMADKIKVPTNEKIKNLQSAAKEVIAEDRTQELMNKLGYDKTVGGKDVQQRLDENSYLKSEKLGGQVAQSVGGMLPQLILGNVFGEAAATATLGTSAYGSGLEQAYQGGATREEAGKYAALNTIKELGTEYLTAGIPGLKIKGLTGLDSLAEKGLSKVKNEIIQSILRAGYKFLGEGAEEALSAILDPLIQNATYTQGQKINWENVGISALVGGLTGGILEGPTNINQINSAIKNQKQQNITTPQTQLQTPAQTNIQDNTITPTTQQTMQEAVVNKPQEQKVIQSSLDPNENFVLNTEKNRKQVGITKDFYRNMRNLFDKPTADKITGEFDKAKLNNVNLQNQLATDLKTNIVDKYNIQKGSKDSALIQKYGEKLITEEELKQQSPNNWQNIIEADKYMRETYNNLIDQINSVRKQIYPNVEKIIQDGQNRIDIISQNLINKQEQLKNTKKGTIKELDLKEQINNLQRRKKAYEDMINSDDILRNKRVEKRADYYRHFQEMAEGFGALRNILSTSSDIAPKMVGVSDFTKPNTKFSSIAQRRKGNKTTYDAVGGLLNYIPTASFMINIDPQVYKLRQVQNDLKNQMGDDTSANKAIEFLNEFNNGLAGKQNFIDRTAQKFIGRKALKGLNWLSGRIKSNMILGNVSSSISQILNLPQVVGKVKDPVVLAQGFADTFNKNTDYSKSQFITERYKSDILSQFDNKLIQQPKKFATWMLGALDELVTKTGWNSLYRQAVQQKLPDPVQYADNNIRDLVAGRGIGEKTVIQESKIANLIMPFTVEVGNLNRVMGDFAKEKDIAGLFIMFIMANLLNKAIKKIGGGGRTFDPIEAIKEAVTEEDISILERLGRVAGEVVSNIPLGQQVAKLYPEYGTKVLPTRKELFGSNDPTRFGTGSILTKAVENPITSVVTPYGGSQIEKIKKGYEIIKKGGEYKDGKLKYPVDKDILNTLKAYAFGSTRETQEFYDKKRTILSGNQTKQVEASPDIKAAYENIMKQREYNKLTREIEELRKQGKDVSSKIKQIEKLFSNGKE